MVPLVNTMDNRNMVNKKLKEHFERILKECQSAGDGDPQKGQVKEIVEEARRVISQYKDYRNLVTEDIEEMEAYIGKIRVRVAQLVEAV